ncbi:hypothetical protein [Nocardia noduli]|uniref:hypothetical protein n=1 Tax=Nocardia noduli TaxID=2815722 RepID=UPI001C24A2D6|nr:hypothetical protein [Nocardia noduli]
MPLHRKSGPHRRTSDTLKTLTRRGQLTAASTMASAVLADAALNSSAADAGSHWSLLLASTSMFLACTALRGIHALWWRYWPTVIVIDRGRR